MKYELDEIKVWVFYLKSNPNELYAYTAAKEIKDKFLEVRDQKLFHIDKLVLDELEFSIFANKYKSCMLNQIPLGYGLQRKEYVMVAMTYDEEDKLNEMANKFDYTIDDLYGNLAIQYNLKKKYRKAIEYLTDTSYNHEVSPGNMQLTSRFNMFFGFTTLFKDTIKGGS